MTMEGALKLKEISYIHAAAYRFSCSLTIPPCSAATTVDKPRNLAKSVTVE